MSKTITTSDGVEFTVDDEDYPVISRFSWSLVRGAPVTTINGVGVLVTRFLVKPKQFKEVTHRNKDKLDNRKSNLMYSLRSNTSQRGVRMPGRTSNYRGVSFDKVKGRWLSRICKDGKQYFLGYFDDEIRAASVYDTKALELFGEEALINLQEGK